MLTACVQGPACPTLHEPHHWGCHHPQGQQGPASAPAPLLPAAAHAVAARFAELLSADVASAQAALLQRDAEGVASFAAAPPLVRGAAQGGAGLRAALSRQLAALQEEAAHWEGLQAAYTKTNATASTGPDPAQQVGEGGTDAAGQEEEAAVPATADSVAPASVQTPDAATNAGSDSGEVGAELGPVEQEQVAEALPQKQDQGQQQESDLSRVRMDTAARMSGQVRCGPLHAHTHMLAPRRACC